MTLAKMSHRNATTKQAGHFRPTSRRGGVLFGPPLRRGSSEYHLRHFLMEAKNQAVGTRRLLGQAPIAPAMRRHSEPSRGCSLDILATLWENKQLKSVERSGPTGFGI